MVAGRSWNLDFDFCDGQAEGSTRHGGFLVSPARVVRGRASPRRQRPPWFGVSFLGDDWLLDGKRIVFGVRPGAVLPVLLRHPRARSRSERVHRPDQHATGSEQTRCARDEDLKIENEPVDPPDGREIAFVASSGIRIMNADGSNRHRVTNNNWGDANPSWQPCIKGTTTVRVLLQAEAELRRDRRRPTGTIWLRASTNGTPTLASEARRST